MTIRPKEKSIEGIVELLNTIKGKITPTTDVAWTSYDSPSILLSQIERYINELKKGNVQLLEELKLLFAPTGVFQELSISNNWRKEYVLLSSRFDELYKSIN